MRIEKDGIKSLLENISFERDFCTCPDCLQYSDDDNCTCFEPHDEALLPEAIGWLEVGVSSQEMSASSLILEIMGTDFVPNGIHFDLVENLILIEASQDCWDLAAAMRSQENSNQN